MKTFTTEQNEMLKAQATEILRKLDEGQNVRDVMAQIYVDNLDEKTLQQGQLMADAILKHVREFDAGYRDAQQDHDKFIDKFQAKMDDGKSCVERCNYWLKLSATIAAIEEATNGENADHEAILAQLENLSVSEEEATPAREQELREQAKLALKNSSVMLSTLAEQAQVLQKTDSVEEVAGMLIDLGNREIEYRAVAAMLAYTKIKNGEFENMPVDMTAAQVATVVCAEAEQARIMAAVGNGSLAVDAASLLLSVLGVVVLVQLSALAGIAGFTIVSFLFSGILLLPACLMVAALLFHVFHKATDGWMKASDAIAKGVVVAVKWVVKGLTAVAAFVATHVLPAIVRTAKDIWNKVKSVAAPRPVETVEASAAQ